MVYSRFNSQVALPASKIGITEEPKEYSPIECRKKWPIGEELYSMVADYMGDDGVVNIICGMTLGVYSQEGIYEYYDHYERVKQRAEMALKNVERRFERIMRMKRKPDFISCSGLGTLIWQTVDMFRDLALPVLKRVTRLCKEAGIPSHTHSCGPERALVEIAANETDLSLIDPLEIPPMGDCVLKELKEKFGDKIVLKGNLHTTDVMLRGSVKDVEDASRKAIDNAGKGEVVMIIDVHEHFCNEEDYLKKLLESMDEAGIDKTCLSPLPPCFEAPGHKAVMEASEKYPERIIPFGYIRLGQDGPKLVENFHKQGFKGFKIHTSPLNYDDKSFYPVYKKVEELNMPILFHTGIVEVESKKGKEKYDVSSARMRPVFIDTIAKAFPNLNIIMAHLGMPWYDEAVMVLKYNPNVYTDLAIGNTYTFGDYCPSFIQRLFFWEGAFTQIVFGGSAYGHSNWILQRRYKDIFVALGIDLATQRKILGDTMAVMLKNVTV